jgi:hypothetical protein
MMKYPFPFPFQRGVPAFLLLGLWMQFIFPVSLQARIGETREAIERRLFGSGGIVYRDDAIESNRRKGMPYTRYLNYLPGSAEVRIYFKTDDGRRPASSELEERRMPTGWDLHVVYVGGKSVIEIYKRSHPITEFEFNHLLALHAGNSYWKRLSKEDKQKDFVSAFGLDMIRSDEQLRAKRLSGDSVIFVDADLDAKLAEMNESDLQEKAPVSVDGF